MRGRPAVTISGSPAAPVLYDARRGVYYVKPVLRGWLHLLCFGASLVFGPLLLASAHGAAQITAVAVYSASVTALFGISALYHRGTWTEAGRQRLQRLDHAMIFFLIAGTATPAFLLDTHGPFGRACLIAMWTLTLTAAAIHLTWMNAPELLVGATFVGLGWAAGLALPWVWIHAVVAGPTRIRRCSATTRSFMPTSAPPRPASTWRSRGSSPDCPLPQGNGDDERPAGLGRYGQALGQSQVSAALGFDDEPAEQDQEHGGHDGAAPPAQEIRPRRRAPGDEGRPHRDRHRAQRGPGDVLRGRAVGRFGRYGDADAGQARDGEHDARGHPEAGQEQGSGHDPPVGSGVAGHHADRRPDRVVGGRPDRAGDQPARGHHHRRQAGRDHRPPRNEAAPAQQPRR